MTVRDAVRQAQRQLASLDSAHARARARLERANAGRAAALAEHDRRVQVARDELDRAVADMVAAVGEASAAELLGIELVEARHAAKRHRLEDADAAALPTSEEQGGDESHLAGR